MLWQPGILPTYFLMFLSTVPVAPMMTGMISTFLFHNLWHSIWISTYLLIFSVAFFWMLQSLGMATSMIWHLSDFFSCMTMSGLLQGTCLSVMIGESHRIVAFSFPHSFRFMLIPALCFHFDAIVPAYVQVQLGSYLVVPVKVLICC